MTFDKPLLKLTTISLSISLLTACSDDFSSGSSDPASNVPDARAEMSITKESAPTLVSFAVSDAGFGEFGQLIQLASVDSNPSSPAQAFIANKDFLFSLVSNDTVHASSSNTWREPCKDGGSFTDNMEDTRSGEKGSVQFNSCQMDGITLDGRMDYSFYRSNEIREDFNFAINNIRMSLDEITMTMNGTINGFCEERNNHEYCITQADRLGTSASDGFFVHIYNMNFVDWDYFAQPHRYQSQVSMIIDTSEMPGSFRISTPRILDYRAWYSDIPQSGELQITGANNTSIKITYLVDGADIAVDTDGSGQANCSATNLTYNELERGHWNCQ